MDNASLLVKYCNETNNSRLGSLTESVELLEWFEANMFPQLICTLATAGIVGNCLTLLTIQSKVYRCLQPFTKLTRVSTVVSILLDLTNFASGFLVGCLWDTSTSCSLLAVYAVLRGALNYFLLVSDFLYLILTIDRYIAICHPIYWHTTATEAKQKIVSKSIVFVFLISLVRFHNGIDFYCMFRSRPRALNDPWIRILRTLADIAFPTIFVGPLIYMNIQIFRSIRRQRQLKMEKCTSTNYSSVNREMSNSRQAYSLASVNPGELRIQANKERKATVGIIMINLVLFLFSLISFYSCTIQSVHRHNYEDQSHECSEQIFELNKKKLLLIHFISIQLLKTCSGSVMFYVYIIFNRTFRREFSRTVFALYRLTVPARSQSTVCPMSTISMSLDKSRTMRQKF
ncbi:unnamed protein product [Soboliphyme baturini]|uniref:G_PROTEIN_RECEP_F1_2 domain-containing protein n=1 Tax=Soboliphyme baturini TaxID=241478 RepID=A0A183IYI0_9BILA|nr:unnamed protein product [Soboliphyme baturini]